MRRVLRYEVVSGEPTMIPAGSPIVMVGVQLAPTGVGQPGFWREVPCVWAEVSYRYEGTAEVPRGRPEERHIFTVITGEVIHAANARHLGSHMFQRDDYNNGAPLVVHFYERTRIHVQMHGAGVSPSDPTFVGPGAPGAGASMSARVAAELERDRGRLRSQ